MGENFEYEKLVVLNNVYHNTLPEKTHETSPLIKTLLYAHQATLVQGMHAYKDKMVRGFMVGNQAINGKLGIIGDPAGSGKTLSVLAYLASHELTPITSELTNYSSKYFFSHDIYNISSASSANLVIVPHSLFGQWKSEIEHHTNLTYVPIETKRNIKGNDLVQKITSSRFVLTTNKCYKFIQEFAKQNAIHWNNVFIDEASSIYINSSDPHLQFQFLWLITNNWIPLLFKNPSINKSNLFFLRERVIIHPDPEGWLLDNITAHYKGELVSSAYLKEYLPLFHKNRGYIVLRNSTAAMQSSIQLPEVSHEIFQCKPNITLNSLTSFYLARNMKMNIGSSKIPYLFQALGIEFHSLGEYLAKYPAKHALIKRKAEDNECIICFDTCEYPTIINCCYNIYCGKCLLQNTLINSKCPTCRGPVSIPMMGCLSALTHEQIVLAKNKMEVCIELCKTIKDGTFIIYSSFDNIYYQLFEEFTKIGLKAERLESNLFSLVKTIKNVKDKATNVIFVSNVDLLRGISLPSISHLIFYHELPVYELKQVLIHSAQRIGRKQPLKILHLNSEIQA